MGVPLNARSEPRMTMARTSPSLASEERVTPNSAIRAFERAFTFPLRSSMTATAPTRVRSSREDMVVELKLCVVENAYLYADSTLCTRCRVHSTEVIHIQQCSSPIKKLGPPEDACRRVGYGDPRPSYVVRGRPSANLICAERAVGIATWQHAAD